MKSLVLSILAVSALLISSCSSGVFTVESPDKEILVTVTTGGPEKSGSESGTPEIQCSVQREGNFRAF